jgi:hypothetical protein
MSDRTQPTTQLEGYQVVPADRWGVTGKNVVIAKTADSRGPPIPAEFQPYPQAGRRLEGYPL